MTKKRKPVWTPYSPDDCIGDFGWLWDSDAAEWLLCATVEPDGKDADLVLVFLSRTGIGEDFTADPEDWRGDPYLSCTAPTAKPGHSDALEVSVRGQGGFYTAMSFGDSTDAAETGAKVFAALGLLGVEDGQT